ncbi:hypothetical protein [Paenibacillus sp. sgz302251]|uniref:hypothetical protein n=1 Tax=Paenibacillus sp. sgz302251 TaxID=3414493 RepID=UPI003C7D70A9
MEYVLNKAFNNEVVYLDNKHFIGCSFTDCTIHITSLQFNYDRCTFKGSKFKLARKVFMLQNVYSLLPSSMKSHIVMQG